MCILAVSESFATLNCSRQVPPSTEFLRQQSWSWWLFSSPGGLPDPGIEPASLMSLALAGEFFTRSYPVATMEFEAKPLNFSPFPSPEDYRARTGVRLLLSLDPDKEDGETK